jgi:transposase
MEIVEVIRRWQLGESQRAIARASGVARETVKKYVRAAEELGVAASGPPPTEDQVVRLVQVDRVVTAPRTWASPQTDRLEAYREQITSWLEKDHLQLTRVQELLGHRGLHIRYSTLERFVWRLGVRPRGSRGDTVRMAATPPGEVAEMDFERLGQLLDSETGRRQWIWGLSITLTYSRHSFLWPLVHQTVEATIEGLEKAWTFFQGCPKRLVLDNFPAAVAGTDPLNPRPTRAFLEYSQTRGFLLDPARVRKPRDKPQIERFVQYARGRFWKGGTFIDLHDARRQAERWCLDVAGQRDHGTTHQLPLLVFNDEERAHLLPYDGIPYDVPLWKADRRCAGPLLLEHWTSHQPNPSPGRGLLSRRTTGRDGCGRCGRRHHSSTGALGSAGRRTGDRRGARTSRAAGNSRQPSARQAREPSRGSRVEEATWHAWFAVRL